MWFVNKNYSEIIKTTFGSLEKVFNLPLDNSISADSLSKVYRYVLDNRVFYIKKYWLGGKGLRKHWGRSRCRGEWENLKYCQRLGIKTPEVVAFGEESYWGIGHKRAILITEEVYGTQDLQWIAKHPHAWFQKKPWRERVAKQVIENVRKLHQQHFIHHDLNWRNILVTLTEIPSIYFFDIPLGNKKYFQFKRFAAKDLARLDKLGRRYLSKTARLKYYLMYCHRKKLTREDKQFIKKIARFF